MTLPAHRNHLPGPAARKGRLAVLLGWLALAVLAVALFATKFLADGDAHESGAAATGTTVDAADAPGSQDLAALLGNGATEADTPPGPAAPPGVDQDASTEAAPSSPTVILAGQVIFHSDDRTINQTPAGTMEAMIWFAGDGVPATVTIEEGAFELVLPRCADRSSARATAQATTPRPEPSAASLKGVTVDLSALTLDGQGTVVACCESTLAPERFKGLEAGRTDVVIHARHVPKTRLHVIDDRSGAPLSGVEVLPIQNGLMSYPVGDAPKSLVVDEVGGRSVSPVTILPQPLDVYRTDAYVLVRASGYAWRKLMLDYTCGRERTVELGRAGALEVTLGGSIPEAAFLRLSKSGIKMPVVEDCAVAGVPRLYESLEPGEYSARVAVGNWWDGESVLVEKAINLGIGERVSFTLLVPETEAAMLADVAGRLIVPEAWGLGRAELGLKLERTSQSLTGVDKHSFLRGRDLRSVDGLAGHYTFLRKGVEHGEYVASCDSCAIMVPFEVGPGGVSDLLIEIPPPVEVEIRTVEPPISQPVEPVERLRWHPTRPPEIRSGGSETVCRDPDTGTFRCRVPGCSITVSPVGDDVSGSLVFDASDGAAYDLKLTRNPTAWIGLYAGDQAVPIPWDWNLGVDALSGDGASLGLFSNPEGRWLGVTLPGTYRLTFPPLDGYVQPEPIEVELSVGPRQAIRVELTSK